MKRLPAYWLLPVIFVFVVSEFLLLVSIDPASRSVLLLARLSMAGAVALLLAVIGVIRWCLNRAIARAMAHWRGVRAFAAKPPLPAVWLAPVLTALVISDLDAWFRVLPDERGLLAIVRVASLLGVLSVLATLAILARRQSPE